MDKKLEVKLVRGLQGYPERQRRTIWSLGLKKLNQTVEVAANAANLGKLEKIRHLIEIREV